VTLVSRRVTHCWLLVGSPPCVRTFVFVVVYNIVREVTVVGNLLILALDE
jgi:hypothetical protein